jgi:hypothetical protein
MAGADHLLLLEWATVWAGLCSKLMAELVIVLGPQPYGRIVPKKGAPVSFTLLP